MFVKILETKIKDINATAELIRKTCNFQLSIKCVKERTLLQWRHSSFWRLNSVKWWKNLCSDFHLKFTGKLRKMQGTFPMCVLERSMSVAVGDIERKYAIETDLLIGFLRLLWFSRQFSDISQCLVIDNQLVGNQPKEIQKQSLSKWKTWSFVSQYNRVY